MNKKIISVIGTAGVPAKYGGFETLAEQLVKNLGTEFSFQVYCSSKIYNNKNERFHNSRLIYLPFKANGKSSILYDLISIMHSTFSKSDTLLVLGVSGAFILPLVKIFTSKTIITNIDGLEWRRDKWGKMASLFLRIQEKIAVRFSHFIVSDNQGIHEHIKENYRKESNLIAYGGNHAFKVELTDATKKRLGIDEKTYAFTVCRIEPENNIHLILEAFSINSLPLIVVGNWQNSTYGQTLVRKYNDCKNITLLDPIYNEQELNELRSNCKLYIHGHSAGGTNPSLVEAMWLGLSIVAWNVNYNKYTTENKAIYFSSAQELSSMINNLPSNYILEKNADDMKSIAKNNYSWEKISEGYREILL